MELHSSLFSLLWQETLLRWRCTACQQLDVALSRVHGEMTSWLTLRQAVSLCLAEDAVGG